MAPPADLRRFLAEASPSHEVRRVMETVEGYDPAVWRRMAERPRLQGLLIPPALGGTGGGWSEMAATLHEMGRVLLCAPFLSTVLATTAILEAGDERAAAEILPEMAAGRSIATVAWTEDDGRWDADRLATVATPSADGFLLDGHKAFVLDGHVADLLVVAATTASGPSLFPWLAEAHPGSTGSRPPTMDLTRKLARLGFSSTPARLLGGGGDGGRVVRRVSDLGAVALAAEQVGGAERCLEATVDHVRTRFQFGRPLGSFQAVKHRCADMLVQVESARSAAADATRAAASGDPDLAVAVSLAKAYCSDAYVAVAEAMIQLHGALGFTWDHDAHLFLKRAVSSRLLFGDPAHHRARVARRLGI